MPLDLADATIVIESPQPGVVTAALLNGCNSVLGAGHCFAREQDVPVGATRYNAEITRVDSEGLIVRISLYRGQKDPSKDLERTLVYSARDLVEPRERATGIVIAAQVLSQLRTENSTPEKTFTVDTTDKAPLKPTPVLEQPREKPAPPPDGVSREIPPAKSLVPSLRWGLDALAAIERGPSVAQPIPGARLGVWLLPRRWLWRGFLSLRYAGTSDDYRLNRFGGSLGFAFCHPNLHWLEPKASLIVVGNRFSAAAATPHRSESRIDYRYGMGLGLEGSVPLTEGLSLLVGGELTLLTPTYDLIIADQAQGSEGFWGYGGAVGLRFGPR